jgi:Spy/CpxP family protein refolding chaperone
MLNNMKKIFGATLASLIIAGPVLAADSGAVTAVDKATASGIERGPGKAFAKHGCGPGGFERGKKLDFSDSQLEKMSSLKNQYLDKTASQLSQLGVLERQLRDVLSQPSIDRAKAESVQSKINSLKADLSTARLNLKIDEIGILTPEQREKMRHRMLVSESFGHKFGHGRHFGGGKFGGGNFEPGGPRQPRS